MKSDSNESIAKDTYSSRFGRKGCALIYFLISLLSFILFSYTLIKLNSRSYLFNLGFIFLNLVLIASFYYIKKNDKKSELIVQFFAILFYLATHILIAFSN